MGAVDPSTGMAELAGVDRDTITAWSPRSTQLREWAAHHLDVADGPLSAAQLAATQKATRPSKPEELAWAAFVARWRADVRRLHLDPAAFHEARTAHRIAARTLLDRARLAEAAETIEKASFTGADLIEFVGAQLPVDTDQPPRQILENAVDDIGVRLTAPRAAHQREGHERFTLNIILEEERAVLDQKRRHRRLVTRPETRGREHRPLTLARPAAVGAGRRGQDHFDARPTRRRAPSSRGTVLVLAPTGKAADVAIREGAGHEGLTIAKAIHELGIDRLRLGPHTLVVVMKLPWSERVTSANS
jgi:hypothetical protein